MGRPERAEAAFAPALPAFGIRRRGPSRISIARSPAGNRGAGGLDDAVLARLARALLRVGAGLPLFGGRLFGGRRLALLRLLPGVGFVFRQAGGAVAEDEARGLPRIRLGGLGAPVEPGEEAGDPEGEERRP